MALDASVSDSVRGLTSLSGGADIQLSAVRSDGFDAALLDHVAATPDVMFAIPAIVEHVEVNGRETLLLGVDAQAENLGGDIGQRVRREVRDSTRDPNDYRSGIFLSTTTGQREGVHIGDSVTVSDRTSLTLRVLDELDPGTSVEVNRGDVAVTLLEVAQRITGMPNRLDRIFVVARPGADQDALRRNLAVVAGGAAQVASVSDAAAEARASVAPLRALLGVIDGVVAALCALLVFEMLSVTGTERRGDFALMRLVGRRRSAICCGFLVEVGMVAMAGAVLGVLGGLALAPHVVDAVPPYYSIAFGVGIGYQLSAAAPIVGIAVTIAAALAGAVGPTITATRAAPLESLTAVHARPERTRAPVVSGTVATVAIAVACLLTYVVGAEHTPTGSVTCLLVGGVAALTMAMRGPIAAGLAAVAAGAGVAGQLAAHALMSSPRRTAGRLILIATATAASIAVAGLSGRVSDAVTGLLAPQAAADLVIQASPAAGIPTDVELPAAWAEDVRAIPGVRSVTIERLRWVQLPEGRFLVVGVEPGTPEPLTRAAPAGAQSALAASRGIILTTPLAEALGGRAGDQLRPRAGFSPPHSTIVAVTDFPTAVGIGEATLSLQDFNSSFGGSGASRIEVVADGGSRDAVRARVAALAEVAHLPATVFTGSEIAVAEASISTQVVTLFSFFGSIVVAVAALSLLTSLLLDVDQRRVEIGMLRVLGAERDDVWRAVCIEAVLTAIAGAVIGACASLVLVRAGASDLDRGFNVAVPGNPSPALVLLVVGGMVVTTIVASVLPAARAARVGPLRAIAAD